MLGFTDTFDPGLQKAVPSLQLTADEKKFLKLYRALSDENKIRIYERIQTLKELQK